MTVSGRRLAPLKFALAVPPLIVVVISGCSGSPSAVSPLIGRLSHAPLLCQRLHRFDVSGFSRSHVCMCVLSNSGVSAYSHRCEMCEPFETS